MSKLFYLFLIVMSAAVVVPCWSKFARHAGLIARNYRGQAIPQSMGLIFIFTYLPAALWALISQLITSGLIRRTFMITIGLGILGFIDDFWGASQVKGLRGHFSSLLKGKITTGLLKAIGGYIICFLAVKSLPDSNLPLNIWRAALVALTANLLNLFDLRPGRALKVFFLLSILFLQQIQSEEMILLLFPFLFTALVFFPWDLAGRGMLGDSGANLLGGVLGLMALESTSFWLQFSFFCLLLFVHFLTEKVSLTQMIKRNRLLSFLDNLGRQHKGRFQED